MVEFRLYYNDNGDVLCYSSDGTGPDNKFIVVDSQTYAEGRVDIKIVDGQIVKKTGKVGISKLVPGTVGIRCTLEDVTIIVDDNYNGETITWKTKQYEYGS